MASFKHKALTEYGLWLQACPLCGQCGGGGVGSEAVVMVTYPRGLHIYCQELGTYGYVEFVSSQRLYSRLYKFYAHKTGFS